MQTILIFGGSGCLGKNLIKRYLNTFQIVNYSRDEHKHWNMDQELGVGKIKHVIGDASDHVLVKNTLLQYNPSKIFILHALKHVDRCQENLHSCIQVNLLSVKNVLDCIHEVSDRLSHLNQVLFTSTDKAPSPINAYGMCKGICEELMIEKARFLPAIKFIVVRYGNVLNSTSSLLPTLLKNTSDVYYLTDERMTRFWMTIEQACDTIEYALEYGESGEVVIPKLKSFYIKDMIQYIALLKNKKVEKIGLRPGERLYETLINDTQSIRTIEKENYYHIQPFYKKIELKEPFVYDSNTDIIENQQDLFNQLSFFITP
jgi:UDP-N-acetylglucosamine 4,6-dehydratase/5-epimerase